MAPSGTRNLRRHNELTARHIDRSFQIHKRRRLIQTRTAAITMSAAAILTACASAPGADPCDLPPASQIRPERPTFDNPYDLWRRFSRTADRFNAAREAGATSELAGHAWNVCRAATALTPFTREVATDIRPRFVAALNGVVENARTIAGNATDAPMPEADLGAAITELSAAIPRFWLHPAASLRGRMQPGNPMFTHH